LQQTLVQQFLTYKQTLRANRAHSAPAANDPKHVPESITAAQPITRAEPLPKSSPLLQQHAAAQINLPPRPTILTAQFHPIYTAGLRERVPPATVARLQSLGAAFSHSPRGGQVTFHGPGQLVGYVVLDVSAHGLGAAAYVRMLEEVVMGVCGRYGVLTERTENVGVWAVGGERKIAAVGVRLRRFVASFGVGINVKTDLKWFDHIVACGLEDKKTTSLLAEGVTNVSVEDVGKAFAEEMANRLKHIDGVEEVPYDLFVKDMQHSGHGSNG
jgi:lipoyl(octanoyl) transferase 2